VVKARKLAVSLGAAVAALTVVAAAVESCVLPDFEVGAPVIVDAGMDVVTPPDAALEAGPAHCGKTYPDPPGGADPPISNTIVVAMHSVDLGEGEVNPPGYDLDAKCTCFEDAGPTCVSVNQHCDAPDGVDSAGAQLINLVSIAVGAGNFGSSYFSTQADQGHWSLLIQISNYNGQPNDPSVDVAIFPSKGLSAVTPKWDGSDAWPIEPTSVVGGDLAKPVYTSGGAYVSGGVLVAAMPSVSLQISGSINTITIKLSDGVLTGALSQVGQSWRITDGVIAARWFEPDIFAALSSYRDSNGMPLCTDIGFVYSTAKSAICNGLDILKDQGGAKSLPCDSLSMGIGFKADPAMLGVVAAPPIPSPGCPAASDPINDACNK
jgi:hypothetical protein